MRPLQPVVQGDIVYSKKPHVERSVKERRDERKGEASAGREGYSHLGGKQKTLKVFWLCW
jgi:hypothetical protein